MATLATTVLTPAGVNPETSMISANAGGDKVVPSASTFLRVKNSAASPITVTIDDPTTPQPVGAAAINPDSVIVVTNAQERWIGPLPASRFANPVDGLVAITYTSATTVTVGAFSLV